MNRIFYLNILWLIVWYPINMENDIFRDYGLSLYIHDQLKKYSQKKPCRLSSFLTKHKFNPSQKTHYIQLIKEVNNKNLKETEQELSELGLIEKARDYLNSQDCNEYNKEHFGIVLEVLLSIKEHGVQKMYRSEVAHTLH